MLHVAILNSYNVMPGVRGRETMRVRRFLGALAAGGFVEGRDFRLTLLDIEERPVMDAAVKRLVDEGVDLIQAFGTPNAVTAARATSTVPVVYVGAHPEGIAEDILGADNVAGRIFALPFTSSYKNFRFIRRFLPQVRTVYTAFFENTVFIRPEMRDLHRAARERAGRRVWISGSGGPIGFRTLAGLGYIIGVEYRELVFSSSDELAQAIDEIDPKTGMLMTYNELMHCPGALDLVLRLSAERDLLTIYNNNVQVVARGLLAGIAADWALVAEEDGNIAVQILRGARPRDIPRGVHANEVAWVNLDTARRLKLDLDEKTLRYFDRRISGTDTTLCM